MTLLVEPRVFKRKIQQTLRTLRRADSQYQYNVGWVKLLYCTAYHETDLSRRRQTPSGEGRGLYQINFSTHRDLYTQYLFLGNHNDNVIRLLDRLSYSPVRNHSGAFRNIRGRVHSISIPYRGNSNVTFRPGSSGGAPDYYMRVNGSTIGRDRRNTRDERINLGIISNRFLHALENYDDYATCIARINYFRQRGSIPSVTSSISDQDMAECWARGHKSHSSANTELFLGSLADARTRGHFPF